MTPLVSFIVPTYNAAHYLPGAIDSALAQTYPHLEVIVIDDGSTDDTRALLAARYADDPRVRVLYQRNQGPAAARNYGLRAARGDYVHLLDSDEILLPDKVARSLALFDAHPDAAAVYGPGIAVAPDGLTVLDYPSPPLPSGDVFCAWLCGPLSGGTGSVTGSFMLRRAAVLEVGGFDERFWGAEDWDLWLRLADRYHFVALDEALVIYRRTPDGLHTRRDNILQGRLWAVQKARQLESRRRCLGDAEFDRLEAGRWHALAVYYWASGRRAEVRGAFDAAIALTPSGRRLRRFYRAASYALPARITDWIATFSAWRRRA
jgi:glycosyltransferase involved in cell wall biosynthesis